ncbi:hypothetical protein BGW42_006104 [Actinomortierella wolfii]|nr:hypothetical protein BGW42_006104 [Actinomortierella wolfii]
MVPISLDANLTCALNDLCKRQGVTMFMVVMAAWSAVLSRLSGQEDIVIGTPTANRNHVQIESLIGFFVNTLAVRIDLTGEPNADEILRRVRMATIGAQAHQDLPFEQVVEIVQPFRRMDQTPLFQVMFAWQNNDIGSIQFDGVECTIEPVPYDVAKFDLDLQLSEDQGEIRGGMLYSTALFDHSTIERHVGYLEAMLRWIASGEDQPFGLVDILGPLERELVLYKWNNTDREYPRDRCVHELFEEQVRKSPQAIALVHHEASMTYEELNRRSNGLANQLLEAGIQHRDSVALFMERSMELVISQLAIIKTGAVYVPLDIKAPLERQLYIVSDSNAKLMLTNKAREVSTQFEVPLIRLSAHDENGLHGADINTPWTCTSTDLAQIMYTSGSTGRPKGVMLPHRAIVHIVVNNGFGEVCSDDIVAISANPTFDTNTYDTWATLLNGACGVIIDADTLLTPNLLADALARHCITAIFFTTALFNQHVHVIGPELAKLRLIIFGGEQGSLSSFMKLHQYGGPQHLINGYGPTETTIWSTTYEATGDDGKYERLPIGRPFSNTTVYVLDKYLQPVPIGVVGELYIGGPGVAYGYLNKPDLTAERFIPDPFRSVEAGRVYKTGDLVKYLPDGNIIYIGRNDDQIKIRGFRVELGEIEDRLTEHPLIKEAVVVVKGVDEHKRLVAYIGADPDADGNGQLVHVLRDHLKQCLPEYMVPSAYVRMNRLPVTNNGKVDRRALPDPDNSAFMMEAYSAPVDETEIALAAIWSDLLKMDNIGRHDNFFNLGGHSLLAMRMIAIVRSQLGLELNLKTLFVSPTIAELATVLAHNSSGTSNHHDDEYNVLLPIRTRGSRSPLFCIHPGVGLSWMYVGLIKHLNPEQPLYGLQARGFDGTTAKATSMTEMTLDYIAQIRRVQPHGPYNLLGWSFGGSVAHNMAVELERQGEQVALLAIMDTSGDVSVEDQELDLDTEVDQEEKEKLILLARSKGKESSEDEKSFIEMVVDIAQNNVRLRNDFKPSVFGGNLTFFRATVPSTQGSLVDPESWRPFVRGEINVYDITCKHVEMDTPDHIAAIGKVIAQKLEIRQQH